MSYKWSPVQALSIIKQTYVEDWGKAQKDRAQFVLDNPAVTEFQAAGLTGLKSGKGQAVIFIHGSPANAMRWSQYLNDVPDGYEFIAIDRMGFGGRGKELPDLEKDFQTISEFVSQFENPIVVGHSLGGAIALRLSIEKTLKRLVLIAASLDPSLEKILKIQKLGNKPVLSKILSLSIRHSNMEMLQLPEFMLKTEKNLDDIQAQAVIIHPKDDVLVSHDNVAYARKYLSGLEVIEPETGGHFIPWTHPDLILKAIMGGRA